MTNDLWLGRWLGVCVAVMFLVVPQSRGQAIQQQELLTATIVDGRLQFDPPGPIDWAQLAPRDLVEFDIDEPDQALLDTLDELRNMYRRCGGRVRGSVTDRSSASVVLSYFG